MTKTHTERHPIYDPEKEVTDRRKGIFTDSFVTAQRVVGRRITARREELGLNQTELGLEVGVSAGYISHIEAGRRVPTLQNLFAIADVLGVPLTYLVAGVSPSTESGASEDIEVEQALALLRKPLANIPSDLRAELLPILVRLLEVQRRK